MAAEASDQGHLATYFVIRPFGNLLVFNHKRLPMNRSYLMSYGGIYKQLLTHLDQLGGEGKKFFTTFGAPAVLPPQKGDSLFDPEIKIEIYGRDFSDKDIRYLPFGSGHFIYLKQAGRDILFLDESICLNHGHWEMRTSHKEFRKPSEEELSTLQRLEVDLIIARSFIGPYFSQSLSPEMYYQKVQDLKKR